MRTEPMLRFVDWCAAFVPWTIERETAALREGDRVRVTAADWEGQTFGEVVETWSKDETRMACVELDDLEEEISFPVDDLVLYL